MNQPKRFFPHSSRSIIENSPVRPTKIFEFKLYNFKLKYRTQKSRFSNPIDKQMLVESIYGVQCRCTTMTALFKSALETRRHFNSRFIIMIFFFPLMITDIFFSRFWSPLYTPSNSLPRFGTPTRLVNKRHLEIPFGSLYPSEEGPVQKRLRREIKRQLFDYRSALGSMIGYRSEPWTVFMNGWRGRTPISGITWVRRGLLLSVEMS